LCGNGNEVLFTRGPTGAMMAHSPSLVTFLDVQYWKLPGEGL